MAGYFYIDFWVYILAFDHLCVKINAGALAVVVAVNKAHVRVVTQPANCQSYKYTVRVHAVESFKTVR